MLYLIIGLFILAVIIVIVLSVLKIIHSIIRTIMVIIFISIFAFGLLIYLDSKEMQGQIQTKDKLMLLDYGGVVVAGFTVGRGQPDIIEAPESYDVAYANKDYKSMKGQSYLLFLVKKEALQSVDTVDISGYQFTLTELNSLFVSQNPRKLIEDKVMADQNITEDQRAAVTEQVELALGSQNRFKGLVFAQVFSQFNEDQEFLVYNIKDENIVVYPEPFSFKMIRWTPKFILKWVV